MPVKTKCLFDPPVKSDGKRILITRSWPKGVKEEKLQAEWCSEFAPTWELLDDWKKGNVTWYEYGRRYESEIRYYSWPDLHDLVDLADQETITLLCFEKESNPHCHRHILKAMIDRWAEE